MSASLAIAATPAGAATPTIPGVSFAAGVSASGVHTTFTLTTSHTLRVTCADGRLQANSVDLGYQCDQVTSLDVTGTDQSDSVSIDGAGLKSTVPTWEFLLGTIRLGAGNDVAVVSNHAGSLYVYGGPGDDRLSTAVYPDQSFGQASLLGEDGNDKLTNQGYLGTTAPPAYDPANPGRTNGFGAYLQGGPGSDEIIGSPTRMDQVEMDLDDKVTLGTGPADVTIALRQQTDVVTVDANGNYGPKISVPSGIHPLNLTLPTLTQRLVLNTLGGPDQVTITGKSARTPISVDTGTGTDVLTIKAWSGWKWNKATGTVTQPGAQPITYNTKRLNTTTVNVVTRVN